MNINVTEDDRERINATLRKAFGDKFFILSKGEYEDEFFRKIDLSAPEEPIEPEIVKVQCSRCLHFQDADISESIAIECKWCGEIDAAYLPGDYVKDQPIW